MTLILRNLKGNKEPTKTTNNNHKKPSFFFFWQKITLFFFNANEVRRLWIMYLPRKHWIPGCTLLELDSSEKQKQTIKQKPKARTIALACLHFPQFHLSLCFLQQNFSLASQGFRLAGKEAAPRTIPLLEGSRAGHGYCCFSVAWEFLQQKVWCRARAQHGSRLAGPWNKVLGHSRVF